MVPWEHPSPQPKWHLHRFSRFCRAHNRDESHWPINHTAPSVTTGTEMWPNNTEADHDNNYISMMPNWQWHQTAGVKGATLHRSLVADEETVRQGHWLGSRLSFNNFTPLVVWQPMKKTCATYTQRFSVTTAGDRKLTQNRLSKV